MKRLALPLLLVVAACGGSPAPAAAPAAPSATPSSTAGTTKAPLVAPGAAKVGDHSTCLVSGEDFVVREDSPKVEYEGKTYYFCCAGCDKKFQADPKKYLSKPGG